MYLLEIVGLTFKISVSTFATVLRENQVHSWDQCHSLSQGVILKMVGAFPENKPLTFVFLRI